MSISSKIINVFSRPFKNLQTKAFKLSYRINKTAQDNDLPASIIEKVYKDKRNRFWKSNLYNISTLGLNFKHDHTTEQFLSSNYMQPDNSWFEAVLLKWEGETDFDSQKNYIILIPDIDEYYEDFKMEYFLNPHNYIIGFNPPGVGKSPGSINNPAEYEAAITAIIDSLLAENIPITNITLLGHGFGASIALKTAATYHQKQQYLGVIADRGFSSSAKLAAFEARQKMHDYFKNHWLQKFFGAIAYYFTYAWVHICGANIDAVAAYSKLNPDYVQVIEVEGDLDIPHECSLSAALNPTLNKNITKFECTTLEPKHGADLRALNLIGKPRGNKNSAANLISSWIDQFHSRANNFVEKSETKNSRSSVMSYLYNCIGREDNESKGAEAQEQFKWDKHKKKFNEV